jgi:hypothetical protein
MFVVVLGFCGQLNGGCHTIGHGFFVHVFFSRFLQYQVNQIGHTVLAFTTQQNSQAAHNGNREAARGYLLPRATRLSMQSVRQRRTGETETTATTPVSRERGNR